jgi:hypothetical protein
LFEILEGRVGGETKGNAIMSRAAAPKANSEALLREVSL